MAVMKPQKALEVNGYEIYPLTTTDQIICSDGSRMEGTPFLTNQYFTIYTKSFQTNSGVRLEAVRCGNIVQISMYFSNPYTATANLEIGAWGSAIIASSEELTGFKPIALLSIPIRQAVFGCTSAGTGLTGVGLMVRDTGIFLYNDTSSALVISSCQGSVAYITEDALPSA